MRPVVLMWEPGWSSTIVGDSLRRRGWTFAWSLSNMKKPLTKQLIEGAKVQIYHDISCNRIHADTYLQRRYGYIQGMPEGTKLPCNVKQDTDADMRNWSRRQLRYIQRYIVSIRSNI